MIKKSITWVKEFLNQRPLLLDFFFLIALLFLGSTVAFIIVGLSAFEKEKAEIALIIENEQVRVDEDVFNQIRDIVRKKTAEIVVLKGIVEHSTSWTRLGAWVDIDSLERVISDLAVPWSLASLYYQTITSPMESISLPIRLDYHSALETLVAIKEKIDTPSEDARFNFRENRVDEEKEGKSLDVYATLQNLEKALEERILEVDMTVKTVPAQVTAEELKDIRVSSVAGYFETPYSRMQKDEDRTHNVRLAASMLDGEIIMPGATFSFNETVGPRSEARGFRYAPVIAGGKIVEGMGGGSCQVASTLYAAAFFSGLTIVERVPHSRPSSYIKLGLDATVSYPSKDLKISNPLEYPVAISFKLEGGQAKAEFRAQERPFTVSMLRRILRTVPYSVRTIEDSSLQKGKELISQRGVPGYEVSVFRLIERGKTTYRFQTFDKYPPTIEFLHKGISSHEEINSSGAKPPKPDTSRAYRAPSSLRMVQGEDVWYERSSE